MKPCAIVSAILAASSACIAYVVLSAGQKQQQQQGESAEYDLGSGRMFDAIAPRYDVINKVISLGLDMQWRRAMIAGLQLRPGDRVIDMATGTADVAIMISEELARLQAATEGTVPGTVQHAVVGIDPSAEMLNVGRQKAADAGMSTSRVRLQIGDAQDLSGVPDRSVDKLTMAFGIRNVPDRLRALKEFRRIMSVAEAPVVEGEARDGRGGVQGATGSVVAILELQNPESGVVAYASRAFIRYAAPVLGWALSGSGAEYGHLKNSILNFPTVGEWKKLMAEAGLDVFSHETMGFGTVHLYLARPRSDLDA